MTARLRVVRHARAAIDDVQTDPGLCLAGAQEAMALARMLQSDPPTRLRVSPRLRARETAMPLSALCALEREVVVAYDELPWKDGQGPRERSADVRRFLEGDWGAADDHIRRWREALIAAAMGERGDVVVVTHYVAINVLIGAAINDRRVHVFSPANTSIAEFRVASGGLHLVARGKPALASPIL